MKRLFAATALAVVMLAAPAGAQQYPPAVNEVTATCAGAPPGSSVEVRARTFAPGSEVTITMASDPITLGTATADADGIATLVAALPADTPLGTHTVTATGVAVDGSALAVSATVTIAAGPTCQTAGGSDTDPPAASGALPRTGDDSSVPLTKLGVTLAAVGGVVTAVATKRRKKAAAAAG